MKKTWISLLMLVMVYPAQTQTARFGDSTGFVIRALNLEFLLQVPVLSPGVQQIDTSVLASGWYLLQMGKRFDRIVKVK